MKVVDITVNKGDVLNEVAKTTAYSGAKMTGEEGAYERIFTTKSDREMLERFWTECQVSVCETLKKFLQQEETTDEGWNLKLGLSESFDDTLIKSIKKELFSFFVTGIVANGMCSPTRRRQENMKVRHPICLLASTRRCCSRRSRHGLLIVSNHLKYKNYGRKQEESHGKAEGAGTDV